MGLIRRPLGVTDAPDVFGIKSLGRCVEDEGNDGHLRVQPITASLDIAVCLTLCRHDANKVFSFYIIF